MRQPIKAGTTTITAESALVLSSLPEQTQSTKP